MLMLTYSEAQALLSKSRSGQVKLAHRTYLQHGNDGNPIIQYWYTPVVEILQNGFYRLSSGGHCTRTTKQRINTYAPVNVFQHNREWFLNASRPFEDGIVVDSQGNPYDGTQPA